MNNYKTETGIGICDKCGTEMEPNDWSKTESIDYITKEKRLMIINTFICGNCGTQLTKRYIEDTQYDD